MNSSTRLIRALLLAAAAAILAVAAAQLRGKHHEAEDAVQSIHGRLDALDPATRTAVVARLTSDEAKKAGHSGGLGQRPGVVRGACRHCRC